MSYANGWACTDCLMLLANGETPPELDEVDTAVYTAKVADRTGSGHWTIGRLLGQEGCECEEWDTDTHRDGCERQEFSWSRCDVCGSCLGGARHAVTLWLPHYHYGQNVPGYLPMADEPNICETFEEAKRGLIEDMLRDADSAAMGEDGEEYAEKLAGMAEDVNLWNGPNHVVVTDDRMIYDLGIAYWVDECRDAECKQEGDEG